MTWDTLFAARRSTHLPWPAQLPPGWEVAPIKRCCSMRSGEGITAEELTDSGEFPVYGGNGLRGRCGDWTHDGTFVLIGRQGALCGNVHLVRGRFWASEHAVVAAPASGTDPRWLAHLFAAMDLGQYSVAAAQPGLAVDGILNLRNPYHRSRSRYALRTSSTVSARGLMN